MNVWTLNSNWFRVGNLHKHRIAEMQKSAQPTPGIGVAYLPQPTGMALLRKPPMCFIL